jgi:hypothetical protein
MLALWLPPMENNALYLRQERGRRRDAERSKCLQREAEAATHEGGKRPVALVAGVA